MEFSYQLKTSVRARHVRIAVYNDGKVIVTKPARIPAVVAEQFVKNKSHWILKKLERYKNRKTIVLGNEHPASKADALKFVTERINFYNQHYRFAFGRISIKNHRSVWGSCSAKHNLNFNHKLMQLPLHQADYIIVHELCHLRELNHSRRFWELVAETIPNFRVIKEQLKSYSFY